MNLDRTSTKNISTQSSTASLPMDKTSTLSEVAERRNVSINFLRKEIERGQLRAVVWAPNSHRKKIRIIYRDELAWLESNVVQFSH